jgi:hypothetical protein
MNKIFKKNLILVLVAMMLNTSTSFANDDLDIIKDIVAYKLDVKQAVGVSIAIIENGDLSLRVFETFCTAWRLNLNGIICNLIAITNNAQSFNSFYTSRVISN